jgi:chromosome segregation protein
VKDLSSAVSALTTLRSENLGQADVLVYEPGQRGGGQTPAGQTSLLSHVRSSQISELLTSLLATTVVADNARAAESILAQHPDVTVVTRDGDVITSHRARGGSASSTSLIEIRALIEDLAKKLEDLNHKCDRLKFEISTAATDVDAKQAAFDAALGKLNESDARIAALTEQLAVSGQNIKSATAEVDRLTTAINEATAAKSRDENELSIASNQMQNHGEIAEPDHAHAESLRNEVSDARTTEVEARLAVRTSEERVASISARALALEESARAEREASERAVSRRGARARGAVISQAIAEAAYEALINIERSIAKAQVERSRLETARTDREGETLTVRSRNRELTQELDQLTSSVHRDEIARAEQRMRVEALQTKAVEELGIDIPTLISEYGPDKDVPTFIETESGEIVATELIP